MTQKNKQIKIKVAERDQYICQTCFQRADPGCIAHLIADTKANRKIYGNHIIDHPLNKKWTHISNKCNDAWNIGNNPGKCKKLICKILEEAK